MRCRVLKNSRGLSGNTVAMTIRGGCHGVIALDCSVVIRPKWNLLKCDSEEAAKQSKRSISIGLEKSILPQIKIHPNDSILGFILFAMVRAKTRVRSLGFIAALGEPIHESRLDCISTWLVVANKKHPQHQILQYVAGCLDRNKPAQMS
jgi:hypothetical protein